MSYTINVTDVQDAYYRIKPHVHRTPVMTSQYFDSVTEKKLFFKVEALQKTGSFKVRGAMNTVLSLSTKEAENGVITHSSGNHAQALAVAAKARGIPAYIVMPENAPKVKQEAVADYGAHITLCESTTASREATTKELQRNLRAHFIHPSNDIRVMAGQGTIGLEFIEQMRELLHAIKDNIDNSNPLFDAIVVPVGGGGMISGIATVIKAADPRILVIGAEPSNADDAYRSKSAGKIVGHTKPPETIADGLRTVLGENNWPIVRDLVDEIILVTEDQIINAIRLVWQRLKVCIEPSAGVGVAVTLQEEFKARKDLQRVGVILCGGNIDVDKPLPWTQATI